MGNSKPFGFVDAHDAHGIDIFFGEHTFAFFFDIEHALLQLADSRFERHGAIFTAEQFGLPSQLIDIGHRLFAMKIAGSQKSQWQRVEDLRYGSANRQRAALHVQLG